MGGARDRGRFDWLAECAGAAAPAAAAGFAAFNLAPAFAFAPAMAMAGSSVGMFGLGLAVMRAVGPEPRQLVLPEFVVEPFELDELLLAERYEAQDEALLLEDRYEAQGEALLLEERYQEPDEALLLEDMLAAPEPDSRVVQLFAPEAMPTAGQLKARIDRHLAVGARPAAEPIIAQAPDASDALYAALAELRRSLR